MTEPKIAADFVNQLVDWSATRIQHTHTHTHTQSCNFNRVLDKAAEEEETYMYLIKEKKGPYFCLGTTEKHTTPENWEQQWVPKSTNKWSSEHSKGLEKKGRDTTTRHWSK